MNRRIFNFVHLRVSGDHATSEIHILGGKKNEGVLALAPLMCAHRYLALPLPWARLPSHMQHTISPRQPKPGKGTTLKPHPSPPHIAPKILTPLNTFFVSDFSTMPKKETKGPSEKMLERKAKQAVRHHARVETGAS